MLKEGRRRGAVLQAACCGFWQGLGRLRRLFGCCDRPTAGLPVILFLD